MMRCMLVLAVATALYAADLATTVTRVLDGDTIDTPAGRVRLVGIDTPESKDNSHGAAMSEGASAAAALLVLLPAGASIRLVHPDAELPTDRYKRILAVVVMADGRSAQEAMIGQGWTAYWRKYGDLVEPWHGRCLAAEQTAERARAGAWATIPEWMRDKRNERTAPKGR
jgi:endonuclease YncB( thermonuclease family)